MSESITKEKVLEALSQVYDPEIPIDIVNLGLVYSIKIENDIVDLEMTMTSPGCPSAREIIMEAQNIVSDIDGVKETNIEIVWDPPWSKDKMSEAAKLELNL